MQNHEAISDQQKGFHWVRFGAGLWIRIRIFNDVQHALSREYGQVLEIGSNYSPLPRLPIAHRGALARWLARLQSFPYFLTQVGRQGIQIGQQDNARN